LSVAERILLTLWVGGMWAIGYIVAPTLFVSLEDNALAGTLAGRLFELMSWIGLVCGVFLLIGNQLRYSDRRVNWRAGVLLAMLTLILIGQLLLAPRIAELRLSELADSTRFARLHGVSQLTYLITSLLGLALVIAPPDPRRR
jgi:uncharacterized membrane protein